MPQRDKEKFYVNYGERVMKGHGENLKGKMEGADLSAIEIADDWETQKIKKVN